MLVTAVSSTTTWHVPQSAPRPYCLQEVKEKKRWGRLQKLKGDVALLAGSPRDAFEHYKSSLDLSKAAGDFIW